MSAVAEDWFAWDNIAADACVNMLYFANRVDSSAMSTSIIRLLAASKLAFVNRAWSSASWRRAIPAAFVARNVAIFSKAFVKKPILSSLIATLVVPLAFARDFEFEVPTATLVVSFAPLKFRALRGKDGYIDYISPKSSTSRISTE